MDLYQKNQQSLRKLLAKRLNPCSQIFKGQPLMSTSSPITAAKLSSNAPSSFNDGQPQHQIIHTPAFTVLLDHTSNSPNSQSSSPEEQSASEEECDGSPLQDKLQKKVKRETREAPNRKSSFEEEREESTSCETHSDGTYEIPDFFLTPKLRAQSGKGHNLEEFRLDDDFSTSFLTSSCDEEVSCLKEARTYAQFNQGTCCTVENFLVNGKLKFKCRFNHQWATTGEDMKKKWCPRCEELLKDYQDFALQNGGHCTNQNFQENIGFSCHRGHSWQLNHKNAKKRWCLDCIKEEKNNMRKKCEEERAQREREEEEFQRKLFEDARKKAAENSANTNTRRQPCQNAYPTQNVLEYFQKVDYEVEKLAQKYSVEFMSQKEFTGDVSYQQILQVYKLLIMPDEILQNYMGSLNSETLKSEFRRFAKILHPDKNKHPQAGCAFQKIYKVYESALARIECSQRL